MFATVSGAHLYGFPSADSDYDLRGSHILPAREVVGLLPARETVQVEAMRGEVEMAENTHRVAADRLKAEHGVDCEVIDIRSLVPLPGPSEAAGQARFDA